MEEVKALVQFGLVLVPAVVVYTLVSAYYYGHLFGDVFLGLAGLDREAVMKEDNTRAYAVAFISNVTANVVLHSLVSWAHFESLSAAVFWALLLWLLGVALQLPHALFENRSVRLVILHEGVHYLFYVMNSLYFYFVTAYPAEVASVAGAAAAGVLSFIAVGVLVVLKEVVVATPDSFAGYVCHGGLEIAIAITGGALCGSLSTCHGPALGVACFMALSSTSCQLQPEYAQLPLLYRLNQIIAPPLFFYTTATLVLGV
mmetsp:Transcript_10999/g.30829  ORF Transcript_10999/g.30829 Transcript_10999/m.30829 type:complete len:258 (+) Transcript_10999:25-798(+)